MLTIILTNGKELSWTNVTDINADNIDNALKHAQMSLLSITNPNTGEYTSVRVSQVAAVVISQKPDKTSV